jgi:hypothetical protein
MDVLAGLTAELFKLGIRFRKINLSCCFTAGMDPGGGCGAAVDFSHALQVQFCDLLTTLVDPKLLDGCMVCGYRNIIILYDSHSPYLKQSGCEARSLV